MSDRACEFLNDWFSMHVQPLPVVQRLAEAVRLATKCRADATASGIPTQEIEISRRRLNSKYNRGPRRGCSPGQRCPNRARDEDPNRKGNSHRLVIVRKAGGGQFEVYFLQADIVLADRAPKEIEKALARLFIAKKHPKERMADNPAGKICERVAEVQALLEEHLAGGKHLAAHEVPKAQAVFSEPVPGRVRCATSCRTRRQLNDHKPRRRHRA